MNPSKKIQTSVFKCLTKNYIFIFLDQFSALNGTTKVLASPGAGILTRSLNSRKSAWSESDIKLNKKLHVCIS